MTNCYGFLCFTPGSLFLFLIALAVIGFFILPIPLLHLIPSQIGDSRGSRFLSALASGIALGIYEMIGALLVARFLASDDPSLVESNFISNPYYAHQVVLASIVAGIFSGVLIRLGMRFKKATDIILFVIGILILLALAIFAAYNVVMLD